MYRMPSLINTKGRGLCIFLIINMDFCSKNAFLSYEQDDMDIDTNIVSINFSVLKGANENLHQGDPNRCERC